MFFQKGQPVVLEIFSVEESMQPLRCALLELAVRFVRKRSLGGQRPKIGQIRRIELNLETAMKSRAKLAKPAKKRNGRDSGSE